MSHVRRCGKRKTITAANRKDGRKVTRTAKKYHKQTARVRAKLS